MYDMALRSAENGMSEICFTDHVEDCAVNDALSFTVVEFESWEALYAEHEKVREALKDKLDVRLGAELSSINHMPEKAKYIYDTKELDFIIGSVHNLRNCDDFYFSKFDSLDDCMKTIEEYLDEYIEVADVGCCDVLGHLGYPQKYMARQGFFIDIMQYEDKLRELFSRIIPKGIGIEVNSSALHDVLGDTIPGLEIVRLYHDCGGEIITAGSDAHIVKNANIGIADAYELIKEAGFKYITAFNKHKPEFIKI